MVLRKQHKYQQIKDSPSNTHNSPDFQLKVENDLLNKSHRTKYLDIVFGNKQS